MKNPYFGLLLKSFSHPANPSNDFLYPKWKTFFNRYLTGERNNGNVLGYIYLVMKCFLKYENVQHRTDRVDLFYLLSFTILTVFYLQLNIKLKYIFISAHKLAVNHQFKQQCHRFIYYLLFIGQYLSSISCNS